MNLLKKGDKLEMIEDFKFEKGDIVTIREVDEDDSDRTYRCSLGEKGPFWVHSRCVRPYRGFKVGDIVKGTNAHRYGVTNDQMTRGEVCGIHGDGFLDIKILEHSRSFEIGRVYKNLDPQCFALVDEKPNFKVGQIYRVGKLSDQHQWEDAIIRLSATRPYGFEVKAIRGEAPHDFGECSEYARSLALFTGSEIGEAIKKYDVDHAEKKTGVREVKRNAAVGEWIKVLTGDGHHAPVGEIFKVTKLESINGWVRVFLSDTDSSVLRAGQYVVLEGYKPELKGSIQINGKHIYTAEQIAEAKKLCGEMLAESLDGSRTFSIRVYDKANGGYRCVTTNENETQAVLTSFDDVRDSTGTATCSGHDEYNVWIGRCVALCKALHKPIPAFIMGD